MAVRSTLGLCLILEVGRRFSLSISFDPQRQILLSKNSVQMQMIWWISIRKTHNLNTHRLAIPVGEEKYPEKPPLSIPAVAKTLPKFKSHRNVFLLLLLLFLFGKNIKSLFVWTPSFSQSCFSVFCPDLPRSHSLSLSHISKYFPELLSSCKDGDKIQSARLKCSCPC